MREVTPARRKAAFIFILITVTLDDLGPRTRLTLRQAEFDSVETCESHRWGWTSVMDRIAGWLLTREPWRTPQ